MGRRSWRHGGPDEPAQVERAQGVGAVPEHGRDRLPLADLLGDIMPPASRRPDSCPGVKKLRQGSPRSAATARAKLA